MKKFMLLLLIIPVHLFAADGPVNEDELFSGSETVVENTFMDESLKDQLDRRSVAISGEITSAVLYSDINDSAVSDMTGKESLKPYIVGDLFFDARLPGGYKGFGSFELVHDASVDKNETGTEPARFSVKEIFVDFNFSRYIYFRTGKQVLSWGQCYLWNPTDMINIENKSFLNKLESREGTYGIKGHIPFGTSVNIYGFADMNQAESGSDIAGAGKLEFLIKDTEMAFSAWGKRGFHPVYGYDISGNLFGIDIKGEASYSRGSNTEKVEYEGLLPVTVKSDSDVYRASLNLSRDFDFGEKADRINISIEMFYNGDGYKDNPFEDQALTMVMMSEGLYEPNYLSRYYAALFITVNEFITSDFTLTLNGISNIEHKSYIVSSGLTYTNINDFTAGAVLNTYLGDKDGEYRAAGVRYDVLVTAGILF